MPALLAAGYGSLGVPVDLRWNELSVQTNIALQHSQSRKHRSLTLDYEPLV